MDPHVSVTVKEAAEIAEVNPRTIRRWVSSGRLPAEKTPEGYRIDVEDLTWAIGHVTPRTPVLSDSVAPEPFDITPLVTRLEEQAYEITHLNQQLKEKQMIINALSAGETSDPWFRRLWQRIRRERHDGTPAKGAHGAGEADVQLPAAKHRALQERQEEP